MKIDLKRVKVVKPGTVVDNKLYPQFLSAIKKVQVITFPYDELNKMNVKRAKSGLKAKTKTIKKVVDNDDIF